MNRESLRAQMYQALRERIYQVISEPPCLRCRSRAEWLPEMCSLFCCHDLYEEETNRVMAVVDEEFKRYEG